MMTTDLSERWTIWRVLDQRGLGAHSSWSFGKPFSHLAPDEVEIIDVVPAPTREAVNRRAAFLDGAGTLTRSEIRKWARELTSHPCVSGDNVPDGEPMMVSVLQSRGGRVTVQPIKQHVTGPERQTPGLTLWIPGPPKGMHRPRTRIIHGRGKSGAGVAQIYTLPADQQVMHEIRDLWRENGSIVLDGYLAASLRLYMARPKSHFNTRGNLNKSGLAEPLPARKPDLDNAAKIVLDALNGCAYADDCQIVDLHVHRRWAEVAREEGMRLELREIAT